MDGMQKYRQALDGVDAVLADVPPDRWEAPSACPGWTVRDVAGHLVWGQRQLQAWATGAPDPDQNGAPGAPHPGELAGADPVAVWGSARAESEASLTPEALARTVALPGLGEVPVAAIVTLLTTDLVAHTWDVGHALGMDVRIDPGLVALAHDWARDHVVRRPGFFGPELTPPSGSDEQTRMLAFLGRAAWRPAPVTTS